MAVTEENYPSYKVRGSSKSPKMKMKESPKSKKKVQKKTSK